MHTECENNFNEENMHHLVCDPEDVYCDRHMFHNKCRYYHNACFVDCYIIAYTAT